MDPATRKTALRMIPYGLYVLTAQTKDGQICAATVNWVTQTSFEPPLVVVGVKADSAANGIIRAAKAFALNVLGKGQQAMAFAFFKQAERDGDRIGGEQFREGATGAPVLLGTPAFLECTLAETLDRGDHSIFVGEVVAAGVAAEISGRPDEATLWLKDLGEKTFYGG